MRQGIGEAFTLNLIVLFIVIVFGILIATLNYYKAFKVNSMILSSVEKFEGYNSCNKGCAKEEIQRKLTSLGYTQNVSGFKCPATRGKGVLVAPSNGNASQDESLVYCVYYYADDRGANEKGLVNGNGKPIYYNYSAVTYIFVDLPIVGDFKIPVQTKGERTFNFTD